MSEIETRSLAELLRDGQLIIAEKSQREQRDRIEREATHQAMLRETWAAFRQNVVRVLGPMSTSVLIDPPSDWDGGYGAYKYEIKIQPFGTAVLMIEFRRGTDAWRLPMFPEPAFAVTRDPSNRDLEPPVEYWDLAEAVAACYRLESQIAISSVGASPAEAVR